MSPNVTRRSVLRNAVAGAVATGMAGESLAKKPGRKIVGLTADADFDVASRRADSVRHELDFGDVGKAVAGTFSGQALDALEKHPKVRYVEDDGTARALAQTLPWGVNRVDADVTHANGETGAGADVAILDTGIDADHPDLQANVGAGADFTGTGSWNDDNGHGTHCAGIAAAVDNSRGVVGVAPDATLHAGKVLDSGGSGSHSDIAAGIEWVANQGYDVASMSLGGSGSSTLQNAVDYAYDKGVTLVAAAGNNYGGSVGYPAAYWQVIAVSSTDSDDTLSDFSSTGSEVDLAAPGGSIYSTYYGGGYDTLSGTSMACPHVSGAAGHLTIRGYSNWDVRERLQDTAEDLGLSSNEQGAGLLDVEAAVPFSEVAPEIDKFYVDKWVGSDGDYIVIDWTVSDPNANLEKVETTVHASVKTTYLDGAYASGRHQHGPFNYPYSYGVYIDVYDEAGNVTSDSTSVY